jgi:hypothetical protein
MLVEETKGSQDIVDYRERGHFSDRNRRDLG